MISDYHLHSSFSGDSETTPEQMIEYAIELGLKEMCFTDHYDLDYPEEEPDSFLFDIPEYFKKLTTLKARYEEHISIRIGIELGLQKHLKKECEEIVKNNPFDFVIGSSHVVNHMDPYYPEYYKGRKEEACYREYFEVVLENLETFHDFDVYGHLDYIVRYGPNKNRFYSYEAYKDILDEILKTCLKHNIGLELNTGGLAYGLNQPNPHPDILKRYKQLGGEIITVGSDAHEPARLAYAFDQAAEILAACGFTHYTVFKNRKPHFIKL